MVDTAGRSTHMEFNYLQVLHFCLVAGALCLYDLLIFFDGRFMLLAHWF